MIKKLSLFDLQEYDKLPKYYRKFYQPPATTTIWITLVGLHYILSGVCYSYSYFRTVYYLLKHNSRILSFMREHEEPVGIHGYLIMVYMTLRKTTLAPPTHLINAFLEVTEK
jgi:hypothetical protein